MDEIIANPSAILWPQKEVLLVPEEQDEQENRFSTVHREAAAQYHDTLREFFAEKGSHWTHPVGSRHIFCPETEAEQDLEQSPDALLPPEDGRDARPEPRHGGGLFLRLQRLLEPVPAVGRLHQLSLPPPVLPAGIHLLGLPTY